jgi:flagellar biosynthesis/type III secretory pathway protein FliH
MTCEVAILLRAPGSRRIPAALFDASAEAARLVDAARSEAQDVVSRADAAARSIRARAAAEGREEGLGHATGIVARAVLLADQIAARAEPQLVELAFAVASRVLAHAVERDPVAAVEVAARALEAARHRIDVTLRVHPEDLVAIREAEEALEAGLARARRFQLVADPSVGRGGAVVETEAGTVDARLDRQLAALREALAEVAP